MSRHVLLLILPFLCLIKKDETPFQWSQSLRTIEIFKTPMDPLVDPSETNIRPYAYLRSASHLEFPLTTDSNSPSFWGADGRFYLFNSIGLVVGRSSGANFDSIDTVEAARFVDPITGSPDVYNGGRGARWIEAVWLDDDTGTLYGWYHAEPWDGCRPEQQKQTERLLSSPEIGAARSFDNGLTWEDLGIIINMPPSTSDCGSWNYYFSGGNGDFSTMLDQEKKWLYFYFSVYAGPLKQQGITVARLAWEHRDHPQDHVLKWYAGDFQAAGLMGQSEALFPAKRSWDQEDVLSYWGPSIHWNTHVKRYVMLLNKANNKYWNQDGIFISYSKHLADGWSDPQKIQDGEGGRFYPQVLGKTDSQVKGTDKLAGSSARFFLAGQSDFEIVFDYPMIFY